MQDAIKELCDLLEEAGARMTFDRRRTWKDPCWLCKTEDRPRTLVTIGRYTRPMGGNIQPGDAIQRPLCAQCEESTTPVNTPETSPSESQT